MFYFLEKKFLEQRELTLGGGIAGLFLSPISLISCTQKVHKDDSKLPVWMREPGKNLHDWTRQSWKSKKMGLFVHKTGLCEPFSQALSQIGDRDTEIFGFISLHIKFKEYQSFSNLETCDQQHSESILIQFSGRESSITIAFNLPWSVTKNCWIGWCYKKILIFDGVERLTELKKNFVDQLMIF